MNISIRSGDMPVWSCEPKFSWTLMMIFSFSAHPSIELKGCVRKMQLYFKSIYWLQLSIKMAACENGLLGFYNMSNMVGNKKLRSDVRVERHFRASIIRKQIILHIQECMRPCYSSSRLCLIFYREHGYSRFRYKRIKVGQILNLSGGNGPVLMVSDFKSR